MKELNQSRIHSFTH